MGGSSFNCSEICRAEMEFPGLYPLRTWFRIAGWPGEQVHVIRHDDESADEPAVQFG